MKSSDGRVVTVLAFKGNFNSGNMFDAPKQGKEYVQVVYSLLNGSKAEWSLPLFEIKVIDANGQKYDSAFVSNGNDHVDSLVAGGKVPSASQVYEVPVGSALDAAWRTSLFGGVTLQTKLR